MTNEHESTSTGLSDIAHIRQAIKAERDAGAMIEMLIADTITKHPKRRGELRSEYTRRILRLAREAK